jgi:hypothetical protein
MSVYRVGGNKSSQNIFPSVRPTLDLDFANSKTLDPRITFTRASGGSYVGADGLIKYAGVNEARFDHDPETGESLGLLVEEARTNLVDYGNTLMSEFTLNGVTRTPNAAISPDGTNSATNFIEAVSTGEHFMEDFLPSGTGNYTHSIFIKKANSSGRYFRIRPVHIGHSSGVASSAVEVDLDTESFIKRNEGIITSKSLTKYPNGWFRLSVSLNIDSSTTSHRFRIQTINPTGSPAQFSYPGDGISGFYVWGAQVEAGAFPTSYIPTIGSTRTRAADNASITGKNFSDFFNFNEGTSFVSFKFGPTTLDSRFFVRYSSGGNVSISQRTNVAGISHALQFVPPSSSSTVLLSIPNTSTFTAPYLNGNSCFSYKSGDIAYSTSGFIQYTNNPTFLPLNDISRPANSVNIGSAINSNHLNGWIKRFTYFPKRLPNEQLIALTR